MFGVGIVLLVIGALLTYGSKYIGPLIGRKEKDRNLFLKLIGVIIGIIGAFIVIYSRFPGSLEFIRIIKR